MLSLGEKGEALQVLLLLLLLLPQKEPSPRAQASSGRVVKIVCK